MRLSTPALAALGLLLCHAEVVHGVVRIVKRLAPLTDLHCSEAPSPLFIGHDIGVVAELYGRVVRARTPVEPPSLGRSLGDAAVPACAPATRAPSAP